MVKKLSIAAAVLLPVVIAGMVYLSMVRNNSDKALAIADRLQLRSEQYYFDLNAGTFDYDRESSVLGSFQQDYNALKDWAISASAQAEYEENLAKAQTALASAKKRLADDEESRRWAEERMQASQRQMQEDAKRYQEWHPEGSN